MSRLTLVSSARVASRQRGVVLLGVLAFILITTVAASSLVVAHATQARREKEEQLLFVGEQYRRAIASYYNSVAPRSGRSLPPSLEALLQDTRFARPVQHLRRLYPDPMTGLPDWQLITTPGGIVGIKSRSSATPLKMRGFDKGWEHLQDKTRYSDWQFAVRL